MVGIVLVSHSRPLVMAVKDLVLAMTGPGLPVATAAGTGENHAEFGTDAMEILEAIQSVMSEDGVLVLMDMGSALLSAETALDFMEEPDRSRVHFCSAPFLEGAISAGVTANTGSSLEVVAEEAGKALKQKQQHLGEADAGVTQQQAPKAASGVVTGESIVLKIQNIHGLHARPAARFIKECGRFQATITVENLTAKKGPVSAKSLSAIASLEVLQGNEIRVTASGADASAALATIKALVVDQFGENNQAAGSQPATKEQSQRDSDLAGSHAVPIGDGIAVGPAIYFKEKPLIVDQGKIENAEAEQTKLQNALEKARESLTREVENTRKSAGAEQAGIFEAQLLLLDDPEMIDAAKQSITREKLNAAFAWQRSFQKVAAQYRDLKDEYLRQRAADIEDIGKRVLVELGAHPGGGFDLPEPGIVVVDDLVPAQVSQLRNERVLGVICLDGDRTSHSTILLKTLGVPVVVQARNYFANIDWSNRTLAAFNGETGEIWINPDPVLLKKINTLRKAGEAARREQIKTSREPAVSIDGHELKIFANVADAVEASLALRNGAEGVGLLRTEFLFLHRDTPPDEEEQLQALRPIIDAMGDHPVVIRTLDAGGDKELKYLDMPPEANPFLGVRALRISLRKPELFQTQLRALLRAGERREIHIMFPMVTEPAELRQAQKALETAHTSLEREKIRHAWPVRAGIMIEVPSAAIMADTLAQECDFFSIGTNDLTQYTLASDRGNPHLGSFQDALHPAVLILVKKVVDAAHRHGKQVAVCGEAAGDLQAGLVFAGLGVDELSMTPTAIPKIKAAYRRMNFAEMQELAVKATMLSSAAEVREQLAGLLLHSR